MDARRSQKNRTRRLALDGSPIVGLTVNRLEEECTYKCERKNDAPPKQCAKRNRDRKEEMVVVEKKDDSA